MRIGLIDADAEYRGKVTYPNLALMKLSAWHKAQGDSVEWYPTSADVLEAPWFDKVYISRVFSEPYTKDFAGPILADEIIRGGAGYAIDIVNERECYYKDRDPSLPSEVEHMFPDYALYPITLEDGGHAYGYTSRGCPRGCDFCHIAGMQGRIARKIADVSEFWNGQKTIHLCDPNVLACRDWKDIFQQLIDTHAYIDFNQGLDIRLLTDEKLEYLNKTRYKTIHFAWDRPEEDLTETFLRVRHGLRKCSHGNTMVYILCNNGEPFEEDVRRVEFIKSLNMQPYVMIYREDTASKELKRLKRYANNCYVCWGTPRWEDYQSSARSERFGKTGMKHKAVVKDWKSTEAANG